MTQIDFSNKPRLKAAFELAKSHHCGITRKYTGEPYVMHPIRCTEKLLSHGVFHESALAAMMLHDCLEDADMYGSKMRPETIHDNCGSTVLRYVELLTNTEKGPRALRKRLAADRITGAPPLVRACKLADIIDNLTGIAVLNPPFAELYLEEKKSMLDAMGRTGTESLWDEARDIYTAELNKLAVFQLDLARDHIEAAAADDRAIQGMLDADERSIYADIAMF